MSYLDDKKQVMPKNINETVQAWARNSWVIMVWNSLKTPYCC